MISDDMQILVQEALLEFCLAIRNTSGELSIHDYMDPAEEYAPKYFALIAAIEKLEAENAILKTVQGEVAAVELRTNVADANLGALVRQELPGLFTAIAGDYTRVNQAGICDPDYVAIQVNQEGCWSVTGYWDDGDETKSHDYISQDSIEKITERLKDQQ